MKPRQHFIHTKAVPTFIFGMQSRQYFIRTETAPTSIFAMELRQRFICTEAMPIFVFTMTSRQHLICIEVIPTLAFEVALAPIFRGDKVQTSRIHSTIARHQDFRDANKTLTMQRALIKLSEMPIKVPTEP